MDKNYVCYHLHTEDSLLDSCTNFKLYVDRAKELEQKAIAFTEHGNIYHWVSKYFYCKQQGIKYIHGIECYLTETLDEKIRDNYHTILLAKNRQGFEEINRLYKISTSESHTYYKPRLTFDEFLGISDNVVKISACVQSPLNKMYKDIVAKSTINDQTTRQDMYMRLLEHYDYYEIQYHNMEEQIEFNKFLYDMSLAYNKPLIVGTDTHSLNNYKAECRVILQYGKTDGAWGDGENDCDLTYKSYDELVEKFKEQNSLPMDIVLDAINNTNVMADSIEELEFDTRNKYPLLYGDKDEEVLWSVLHTKYDEKVARGEIDDLRHDEYWNQINEEMRVFKKTDMIGFMLFMSEIISWAKSNNIPCGFARGSCAGSTVAYISDIIDVDPIKWKTIFSRFANENRVEAGDIDTDWYEDDRPKIYDYIIERFGTQKTSYILAVGTLAEKSVIDVIGKAFRIKDPSTIYTLDKIASIKSEYDKDQEATKKAYPDIFYYYDGLCGCVVSQSQHPAGIVVSSLELTPNFGNFYGADNQLILPIDMEECHDMGLIKFDILGLKSVGVIKKTCQLIGTTYPKAYQVDWNDQNVLVDISNDSTTIFQFESDFARDSIKKMNCKSVDDMCLCSACIRPSGESYRDKVFAREWNVNPSKQIDEILSNSYGYLVYQEQTIAFLQQACGFSGSEADTIRRCIGKKDAEKIAYYLPKILEGYCKTSDKPREIAEEEAKQFVQVISDSSSYSFGFNHSEAYAMLSYLMGYLRYYYPAEYCTSYLNCAKNDDDLINGTKVAHSRGCTIQSPVFRYSTSEYGCDGENKIIYKGIGSIKDIGKSCGDNLYTIRDKHYDDFIDLLYDIRENKLAQKNELLKLIKIDFFREFGDIATLLIVFDVFNALNDKKTFSVDKLDEYGLTYDEVAKLCEKATAKRFSNVNMKELIRLIATKINVEPITNLQRICYDLEILGYTTLLDEMTPKNMYVVSNVETNKYGSHFATLYNPRNGEQTTFKVRRAVFEEFPITAGDLVQCLIVEQPRKVKDENGKWVDTDVMETIVRDYCKRNGWRPE